jgi:hypothetical protein
MRPNRFLLCGVLLLRGLLASCLLSESSLAERPQLVAPGSAVRHLESLADRAGIWGTLELGLEAWVYPFKALDAFEAGLLDKDGKFVSLRNAIQSQQAFPDESVLTFGGSDWQLRLSFFVPRDFPGGLVRFQGTLPSGQSLVVRLRPVVSPMHGPAEQTLRYSRDADLRLDRFHKATVGRSLAIQRSEGMTSQWEVGKGVLQLVASTLSTKGETLGFVLDDRALAEQAMTLAKLTASESSLREASKRHYEELIARLPHVDTSDEAVDRALLWAGISLDQLRINNPDLGWGLVSGYSSSRGGTRPKYAWYFEEPTLTSWAYHRLGLSQHVREALELLSRYHRQDGKTVHEITQGLKYWPDYFEEFLYAYLHTDGPVYYLVAYGQYLRSTGDLAFIRSHWEVIEKAFSWCRTMVDPEDGLITIDRGDWGSAESSTAMWKDTQLEAMWIRALDEVAYLSGELGEVALAAEAVTLRERAKASLEAGFWDPSADYYIWGLNRKGERETSLLPHHAIGFWLSDLQQDRVERALQTLAGAEFMTDWGARSLALSDPKFDETSYQSGSVWPVWNAGVLISDFRIGETARGFQNWRRMVDARWSAGLGPMPEVFRGDRFELLPEAVPHQMFSEVAIVNGFFDGMLGLEVDVPGRVLTIAPRLPLSWDRLRVDRIPFGEEWFDLELVKTAERLEVKIDPKFNAPVTLRLRPEIPRDALVERVVDGGGQPYFQVTRDSRRKMVLVERAVESSGYGLVIDHSGGVNLETDLDALVLGRENADLRIISTEQKGAWWNLLVEGRPSRSYRLRMAFRDQPAKVFGGELQRTQEDGWLLVTQAPDGAPLNKAGFMRWTVRIKLAERPDREQLLLMRSDGGGEQTITSKRDWEAKVERIKARMQRVAGRLPGEERKVPLNVRVVEEVDCGSYWRRKIFYQSEPGSEVPAYLAIPKTCLSEGKQALGILALHPTDNRVGHDVVHGLGGRPGRQYAAELAALGFVTLAPSYPLLANYQPDLAGLGYQSGTMKAIWDNLRALDLLETLDYVVPGRYGAIGHSLGGHNAIYTAVFDPRIQAVVTSCGFDSYLDYKGGDIRGWTSTRYMPHLLDYELGEIPFDFHELIGAMAPRGILVSAPKGDTNFRWESVGKVMRSASSAYALYAAADAMVVRHPDCGHDFPEDIRREAYAFLAERLAAKSGSDQ